MPGIAGHHLFPNGDLLIAHDRGRVLLIQVWKFFDGRRFLMDSYCEDKCQECGCPEKRYHAVGCKRAVPALEEVSDGSDDA